MGESDSFRKKEVWAGSRRVKKRSKGRIGKGWKAGVGSGRELGERGKNRWIHQLHMQSMKNFAE